MTKDQKQAAKAAFENNKGVNMLYVCKDGACFLKNAKSLAMDHARKNNQERPDEVQRTDIEGKPKSGKAKTDKSKGGKTKDGGEGGQTKGEGEGEGTKDDKKRTDNVKKTQADQDDSKAKKAEGDKK